MKTSLQRHLTLVSLLLLLAGGRAFAQAASPGMIPSESPLSGLPSTSADTSWKDTNWVDLNILVTNLVYDGLPISEVARDLRLRFNNGFDILIPNNWQDPRHAHTTPFIPSDEQVNLQLKNVRASEIFNAMNMLFVVQNEPLRWELRVNGNRPMVLLRVNPILVPDILTRPVIKRVYYIGYLTGDQPGSMTMSNVVQTINSIYNTAYGDTLSLQYHEGAQLLIVSGTDDQINFLQMTLEALRSKVDSDRATAYKASVDKAAAGISGAK